MKNSSPITLPLIAAVAALALPLGALAAEAGEAKKPAAKKAVTAKKPAADPAAAAKPAAAPAKRRVSSRTAQAVEALTPVHRPSDRLSEAELEIAKTVYTGTIPCELGANVTVTADEKNPGFFVVTTGKLRYYMHPVESRTGSIRMEDNRAGAMWLQLGSKSMLMNQKLGQRVADDCTTPRQREVAADLRDHPRPSLFEGPAPAASAASAAR
jgi:hypothetical protein